MSQDPSPGGLREVIGKALIDPDYREQLYNDQDEALKGYSLTDDEKTTLNGIDKSKLDEQAKKVGGDAITNFIFLQPPPPPPPKKP